MENRKYPTSFELLNMLRAHYIGSTDYKIAQYMDITPENIYAWQADRSGMSDEFIMRLCDRLNIGHEDMVKWVFRAQRERTKSLEVRRFYDRLLHNLKTTAALAITGIVGVLAVADEAARII